MAAPEPMGDALLGCVQRQLSRSVIRKRSGSKPPIFGHPAPPSAILKPDTRLWPSLIHLKTLRADEGYCE